MTVKGLKPQAALHPEGRAGLEGRCVTTIDALYPNPWSARYNARPTHDALMITHDPS